MTGYVCSRCREAFFSAGRGAFLACPKCGGRPVDFNNGPVNEAVGAARKVRRGRPAGSVLLNMALSDYEKLE